MLRSRVHRWLAALADPAGTPRALPRRRLSPGELAVLVDLADRHGVLPAVAANLRRLAPRAGAPCVATGSEGAPDAEEALSAALDRADEILRARSAVSLLIRRQVDQIARRLSDRSVPVMVLKGSEFADRLYPQPGLRPFTDADLLVPREARDAADAVMAELGYRAKAAGMKYREGYGQRGYCRAGAAGNVEIHTDLVNSPTLRKRLSVTFDDLPLTAGSPAAGRVRPSAVSLLLTAGVHAAAGHCFDRLQPLCDVLQATRGAAGDIDADELAGTAERTGTALAMAAALDVAGRMFREPQCGNLARRSGLCRAIKLWRPIVTAAVVLRAHAWRDSFRRQLFRAILKTVR